MLTVISDEKINIVSEHDSINFLENFIDNTIKNLTVIYLNDGFERKLDLNSSNGVFLISGFDSSDGRLFTLRESTMDGVYEIGDGIWSGVYLTRDIQKVITVFIYFIENKQFDENVLVYDEV